MSTVAPSQRPSKPPPAGPAPPAPAPAPSTSSATPASAGSTTSASKAPAPNGTTKTTKKAGKAAETPVDPQAMYESLKTKIAALEEELNTADEAELKYGKCLRLAYAFTLWKAYSDGNVHGSPFASQSGRSAEKS